MLKYIILALTIVSVYSITCGTGEFLDGTKCKQCSSHCSSCSGNTTCLVCENGFYLDVAATTCLRSTIANCIKIDAAATKVCKKCASGFWLKSDKSCVANTFTGCSAWTDEVATESCSTVLEGYFLSTVTPTACAANCKTCASASACTTCKDGFYKSNVNVCTTKAKKCKAWKEYTDTPLTLEECTECPTSYTLISGECYISKCLYAQNSSLTCETGKAHSSAPFCNVSCPANCDVCTTDTTCTTCKSGYLLYSNACYQKVNTLLHCSSLSSSTQCNGCDDTYLLEGTACTNTKIANCQTQSGTTCSACINGYWLSNQACTTACTSPCATCTTTAATCTACVTGLLDGNTCAQTCHTDCKTCTTAGSASACTACTATNKYVDASNACQTCEASCATCSGAGASACTSCGSDKYYNAAAHTCTTFSTIEHCTTMATATTCSVCAATYSLLFDKTACILTTSVVSHCTTMATSVNCHACDSGYAVAATPTSCVKCATDNCAVCSNDGATCTTCNAGYSLEESEATKKVCVQCSQYKKYAGDNCEYTAGWREFPYKCSPFTTGCTESKPTPIIGETKLDCKTCGSGYKVDTTNKNCTACPAGCSVCNTNACDTCKDGYYLKSADNTCVQCDTATCSQCSATECLDCKDNFGFFTAAADDKTKCTGCITNCKRCDTNATCVQCNTGFYLDTTCKNCSAGCSDCDDATKCYSCMEGYYLDGTACKKCIDNCKTCKDGTTCTDCKTDYTLSADKKSCTKSTGTTPEVTCSITGCIKCATTTTCAQCQSGSAPTSDGKCSCDTGKVLVEGECVTQEAALPADLATVTTVGDLKKYITAGSKDAANTKKVLTQLKTLISATGANTKANAKTALQVLVGLAGTTADADSATSFTSVLETSCGVADLDQSDFEVAFNAADKCMKNASDPAAIFKSGFNTCLLKLLGKTSGLTDINTMKLTNSEFAMKSFSAATSLTVGGATVEANADVIAALGTGTFYATVQTINIDSNPYSKQSTNTVTLSSKIVSLSVWTTGASAASKKVELANNKTFPITFDATATNAKCGYYDTTNKKWVAEGTIAEKKCSFTHMTDFAIFTESSGSNNNTNTNAYTIQVFSIILIFIIALF